jgi:hypothetical protein
VLSLGTNKVLLTALAVLAILSLVVKAKLGPTVRAPSAPVEAQLATTLQRQGFAATVRPLKIQSTIVYGRRGNCTLSVRNAFGGAATEARYAEDAKGIGPVRYLYKGNAFSSPPTLRIHMAVIEDSVLRLLGVKPRLHVPLALAASPACGSGLFGFGDLQLPG